MSFYRLAGICLVWVVMGRAELAAGATAANAPDAGPYNLRFLDGGIGSSQPVDAKDAAAAGHPWTMMGWLQIAHRQPGVVVAASFGAATGRAFLLGDGEIEFSLDDRVLLRSGVIAAPEDWHAVASTFDGSSIRLFVDGREVASSSANPLAVAQRLEFAPVAAQPAPHFGGAWAQFTLTAAAIDPAAIGSWYRERPAFSLTTFNAVGVGWPLQEHAWRGLQEPQPAWTLPHGHAPFSRPSATPAGPAGAELPTGSVWVIDSWRLASTAAVDADGEHLSLPEYQESTWYDAVVPGTILTTLIARGVYPDPDYGLDNLAIPDSLSRQDYWYRSTFEPPVVFDGRRLTLKFNGINYAASIWLNGQPVGEIRGAFTRGIFDVTDIVRRGAKNAIAVRISPPPHPGIPHEQSVAAGPGNNGGALALDGPTFIASEGWDWIPGIRDRNSGIWQPVELDASGLLQIHDPHVVTRLPLPRTDFADITVRVPVTNLGPAPLRATVSVLLEGIAVSKHVVLSPGVQEVTLSAQEFPELHLVKPRLWWPNGYGAPELHSLRIEVGDDKGIVSDSTVVRFGIRELTYELSLFDSEGRLRRVEVDPTLGSLHGERLVDPRHEAIKRSPRGWAQSLTGAGEHSSAVRSASSESLTPYLVIRVNGVPIAARGGSWGMDDSRKRVSRQRLEPYFELEREAHLNIVRNWLGQDTEEVFYDLADEYGFLVLNDFWMSTQEFQLEPQDSSLFLANARDVIARYRNHPSIAVWFGRNEGVPPPVFNEGLDDLVASLDGTRLYTGSSNAVNLQGSGPYDYHPPEKYFTELAQGFSVEVGTPSLSTLESLQASIPPEDRWPLGDTYAYHDWHFGGNGDVASFMRAMQEQYGAGVSLEDFERKAQMMDYVSYRAIFEGFQSRLWTQNSGRLLWMTHPSWPSNTWQIYASDYDTAAAYYGVKKACEPVHAQLNLPDFRPALANVSLTDHRNVTLRTQIWSLDNRLLQTRTDRLNSRANSVTTVAQPLPLAAALAREAVLLVKMTAIDSRGELLSDNVYWQGRDDAALQRLNGLAPQVVSLTARVVPPADPCRDEERRDGQRRDEHVEVILRNEGALAALNLKLTALDAQGGRVLPVFYEDNYVTLLPGESRRVEVRCPAASASCSRFSLRGWNVIQAEAMVSRPARP